MHARVRTHRHTHTWVRTGSHTHVHVSTHDAHTHIGTHRITHACTRAHPQCTHMWAHTGSHAHACTPTMCTHTCGHTQAHSCTCTHSLHTHTWARTDMHTHPHICTPAPPGQRAQMALREHELSPGHTASPLLPCAHRRPKPLGKRARSALRRVWGPPHSTLGTLGSPGSLSRGLCPPPSTGGLRQSTLARQPGPRWGLTPRLYRGPRPSHPGPPPPWPLLHRTLAQGLCSSVGRRAIPSCLFLIRPETSLGAPVPA